MVARQQVASRWMSLVVTVLAMAIAAAAVLAVLRQGVSAFMSGGG